MVEARLMGIMVGSVVVVAVCALFLIDFDMAWVQPTEPVEVLAPASATSNDQEDLVIPATSTIVGGSGQGSDASSVVAVTKQQCSGGYDAVPEIGATLPGGATFVAANVCQAPPGRARGGFNVTWPPRGAHDVPRSEYIPYPYVRFALSEARLSGHFGPSLTRWMRYRTGQGNVCHRGFRKPCPVAELPGQVDSVLAPISCDAPRCRVRSRDEPCDAEKGGKKDLMPVRVYFAGCTGCTSHRPRCGGVCQITDYHGDSIEVRTFDFSL